MFKKNPQNAEFLKRVACLFKNEFPTVPATWIEDQYQEELLNKHTASILPNEIGQDSTNNLLTVL